jgi:hypothetical protein
MRPVSVAGKVTRSLVHPGSKSERNAVVLETAEGRRYILRRHDGPAFADPELEPLVGKSLVAEGLETGDTLIMRDWRGDEDRLP